MSFKIWLEQQNQPYYRVVCPPLFGASVTDKTGPNTYWTPRWDAVVRMLRTIMMHWATSGKKFGDKPWECKIYQLNNAMWKDSPPEHKWAFSYGPDAGEKVLDKALESPKLIHQFTVDSEEFYSATEERVEKMVDYAAIAKRANLIAKWHNQEVYVCPISNIIEIAVRNKDGWSYSVLETLRNMNDWKRFVKDAKLQEDFDSEGALAYFFMDYNWS